MSRIYVELIKMSRSREEALHKIVEFEQLFFNYRATHPDDAASFPTDAIDSVCRAAYNNGLTLYDLGQLESSLNFLSKAVALLPHTSDHMAIWKDNIQVLVNMYEWCIYCTYSIIHEHLIRTSSDKRSNNSNSQDMTPSRKWGPRPSNREVYAHRQSQQRSRQKAYWL
jgi:hypothetical protein